MLLVTNPTIPSLFQQPGKLNLKAYGNVTDAIGKLNLKDAGLLHSKLTKGGSVHAPLATPENMDLGPDYAAVSTLMSPYFVPSSPPSIPSLSLPSLPPIFTFVCYPVFSPISAVFLWFSLVLLLLYNVLFILFLCCFR